MQWYNLTTTDFLTLRPGLWPMANTDSYKFEMLLFNPTTTDFITLVANGYIRNNTDSAIKQLFYLINQSTSQPINQ